VASDLLLMWGYWKKYSVAEVGASPNKKTLGAASPT
jgi:hypothetical protein